MPLEAAFKRKKESDIQVGLQGWIVRASMKRWRKTTFPSEVVASVLEVADHPCAATRAAYTLWRVFAHTSPIAEKNISKAHKPPTRHMNLQ